MTIRYFFTAGGDRFQLFLPRQLTSQIADQDRPHLRIRSQQDLQVLIVQKLDLAAHIQIQAVHLVQVVPYLCEVIAGLR